MPGGQNLRKQCVRRGGAARPRGQPHLPLRLFGQGSRRHGGEHSLCLRLLPKRPARPRGLGGRDGGGLRLGRPRAREARRGESPERTPRGRRRTRPHLVGDGLLQRHPRDDARREEGAGVRSGLPDGVRREGCGVLHGEARRRGPRAGVPLPELPPRPREVGDRRPSRLPRRLEPARVLRE